jgi:MurNAc alpha-1-phosphate uridylyltransferase
LNLVISLGVKNILINSFYLREKIEEYVANLNLNLSIISDGNKILDTGGGILNLINNSKKNDFLVFNPDTLWNYKYVNEINKMQDFYFSNKLNCILLVADKKLSFDKSFNGDFKLKDNLLQKGDDNNFIYIGCKIFNKGLFENYVLKNFSILEVWKELRKKNQLNGYESLNKFYHLTNLETFKKLKDL